MKLFRISFLSVFVALFFATSCEAFKEKASVNVDLPENVIEFETGGGKAFTKMEVVLLDTTIKLGLMEVLKENNYSFDKIKSIILQQASIELVTPTGFDMGIFKTVKLFFDNRNSLVAQAENISNGIVKIKIVNGELLDKIKNDKLHIILVGDTQPSERIKIRLRTNYKAKVNLLK